jgi:hypothetical protein
VTFPGGGGSGGGSSHVYTIHLVKGWKAGTKISFPPPPPPQSNLPPVRMTFVITEAAAANETLLPLQRRGNDLIFRYKLGADPDDLIRKTQKDNMVHIAVPLLPDGKQVWRRSIPATSSLLRPGQTLTVPDLGMPIEGGPQRGNLIIEFY